MPIISTVDEAKERLEHDIAKAHALYEKRIASIHELERRPPPDPGKSNGPPNFSRYERALSMRKNGSKLKDIGTALGVSANQARMLVKAAERLEKAAKENPAVKELSGRSFRTLRFATGLRDFTAKDVANNVSAAQLADVSNFGPSSINEVRSWLRRNGFDLS